MKTVIEFEFDSDDLARKALSVVGSKIDAKKALVTGIQKKKKLVFTVESDSFAGMRALVTTVFRDVKLFLDSLEVVKKKL